MAAEEPAACHWHDEIPCQFDPAVVGGAVTWQGRSYCQLHLPLAATELKQSCSDQMASYIQGREDLRGVQLPARQYNLNTKNVVTDLRGCVFADHVILGLGSSRYDLSNSCFGSRTQAEGGRVTIALANHASAQFDSARVFARLELQPRGERRDAVNWSMRGTRFWGELILTGISFREQLDLSGAQFHAPVRFDKHTELPQQTRADRLVFKKTALTPDAEGSYRSARLIFAEHKNRELEGVFYACEKRCHRRSLSMRHLRNWLPRALSVLYDYTSGYGHSYGKAFAWFAATQVVFGFVYSIASGRFEPIPVVDWDVVLFTLAQVAKPFDLLSARSYDTSLFGVVNLSKASPFWGIAAFIHTTVSLALIALFLLAVRWRFRRD